MQVENEQEKQVINNQSSKKDIKTMTPEEQAAYYKEQFQKTKKLFLHYGKESKIQEGKVKSLQEKLHSYEPKKGEQIKVIFKLIKKEAKFYFLQTIDENENYFLKESQMRELYSENDISDESIQCFDYEKDLKNSENTINQIIEQYDERVKRLSEEIEKYEKVIMKNKDLKALSIVEVEKTRNYFELGIQNILEKTNDIYSQLKNTLEAEISSDDFKVEIFNRIKSNIDNIKQTDIQINIPKQQNLSMQAEELFGTTSKKWLIEIRSFIISILRTYFDTIYTYHNLQNTNYDQKLKWQNTIDQIIKSHEEEINSKDKLYENLKQNLSILNSKVLTLEQDKYNIAKLKDQQIEILSKENNKKINVNMLKSVLIQIFTTNDQSIQDTVLPVVYTALKFSDTEIKKIKEYRSNTSSLFGFFK